MYKLRRAFIAVLLLLSLAVAANAQPGKLNENSGRYGKEQKAGKGIILTSYPVKENSVYKAKIKRVVDGDTAIIYFLTAERPLQHVGTSSGRAEGNLKHERL